MVNLRVITGIQKGTRLGGYEVRELIGRGGMASVYRGYDTALDREVAIKVIGADAQGPDFVARFQREARVIARLSHPNIVTVYHFGEQDGIVYMVQELLPGPTLAQRIRETGKRRMSAERIHSIITQLAEALDFAHTQGVIHRDVKPANAIYNAQGQLILTDFGIARSTIDTSQTTTGPGIVMGTPGYVAPEQAVSSAALTPACDVYALGVVLFELLCGRLPFEADTPMGVVLKHLYDTPPAPSSLRPELPKALDTVLLRALNKEPTKRYPSPGALARALQNALPAGRAIGETTPARGTPKPAPQPEQRTPVPAAVERTPAPRPAAVERTPTPKRMPPAPAATPKPGQLKTVSQPRPPASAAPRRKTTPAKPGSAAANKPAKPRRSIWPLRVGLLTTCTVGALILFGIRPDALETAWQVMQSLIMTR